MSDSSFVTTFEMDVVGDSETAGKLDSLAGKVSNVGNKGEEAAKKTSAFSSTIKSSALGISAAASSAVSLYNQYDQLEKRQTAVDVAEKKLTTSKAALIGAQERINKLVSEGVTSGADYEQAAFQLQAAQDGLTISQDKLKQATGDMSQAQMGFALQIVPTTLGMVTSLTDVMGKLKMSKLANVAATGAEAVADSGGVFAKVAHTAATVGHTIATNAATVATRLFHIAMGPIGWVILGISGAMALFATNAFGVRDAINSAGKAIGDAVPVMQPLLDALSTLAETIFPEASDKAAETGELTQQALAEMQTQTNATMATFTSDVASGFSTAETGAKTSFGNMADHAENAADKIAKAADKIKSKMDKLGVTMPRENATPEQKYNALQDQLLDKDRKKQIEDQLENINKMIGHYKTFGIDNLNKDQRNALSALITDKTRAENLLEGDSLIQNRLASGFVGANVLGSDGKVTVQIILSKDGELTTQLKQLGNVTTEVFNTH